MPWSVNQGDTIQFGAMFYDANGNVTIPPSATMVVTYTTTLNTSAVANLPMTPVGAAFSVTWNTGVAAIGMAQMQVTSPAGTAVLPDPNLRIT